MHCFQFIMAALTSTYLATRGTSHTQLPSFIDATKRRYGTLPTMHCFQWNVLHNKSCGAVVMRHTLIKIAHPNLAFFSACFIIIRPPHDLLYKVSHWKQCIVGSALYLLLMLPLEASTQHWNLNKFVEWKLYRS